MIIYNITINVNLEIANEWLVWMKKDHIPKVLGTKLFVSATINRVISASDTGITYAVAYKCRSLKDLQEYESRYATKLRDEYHLLYSDLAPTFRTIMEVIEEL